MPPPRPPVRKPGPPRRKSKKIDGSIIVANARSWLGVPYLFGGTTRSGVDCSGLVLNVAEESGIKGCPRTSEAQWLWCEHIRADQVGAGDLVFFVGAEIDPPPGHVGIVVTPGSMIDAPHTGTVVQQQHYADGPGTSRIIGYGRMRGAAHSTSANPYTSVGGPGAVSSGQGIAGATGATIAMIGVIILLVVALLILLAAGFLFGGTR